MNSLQPSEVLNQMDHAAFDAALIGMWHPNHPWVFPNSSQPISFEPKHFIAHTRTNIVEALAKDPIMKKQKLTEDRKVLDYIAFEMLHHCASRIHVRQRPLDETCKVIREDFRRCVNEQMLRIIHPWHPLMGQGENAGTTESPYYMMPLTRKWDIPLLQHVSGGHMGNMYDIGSMKTFMRTAVPYLTELDRTQVTIHGEKFRADIWQLVQGHTELHDDLRKKLTKHTVDYWLETWKDGMALLTALQEKLSVDLLEGDPSIAAHACFDQLLSQGPDEDTLTELRDRMIAIEWAMIRSVDEDMDASIVHEVQDILRRVTTILGLNWSNHPSLAYVDFALMSKSSAVNGEALTKTSTIKHFL